MKLFGREIFNFKKEPEKLYDFAQHGLVASNISSWGDSLVERLDNITVGGKRRRGRPRKVAEPISPKNLFKLGSLNNNDFAINTDKAYLDAEISKLRAKLVFLDKPKKSRRSEPVFNSDSGPSRYGAQELESMIERLENRKKISKFKDMLDEYPHTTSAMISKVITENKHLGTRTAERFVPDFPEPAIDAMERYTKACVNLCGKKPVFYVIAKKEDFEEVNRRRDPILLAQSPFGHFWQILGAWDEEMIYLADL